MKIFRVGVLGATGMVGRRFITLLAKHPWFCVSALAAGPNSAGKIYREAVCDRWCDSVPIPNGIGNMTVFDASADIIRIASLCDFVFCALDMPRSELRALEEQYARLECPVVSTNSAHRTTPDVPMIIPEVNPGHLDVIPIQRRRLGTSRGFIAVKSNCSIQSYVIALEPLRCLIPKKIAVCSMQAVSGAGKTMSAWSAMQDNIIPFIPGEEEKSELEPLKIWGTLTPAGIVPASTPDITAQCVRVPISDGHMAAVFATFEKHARIEEMRRALNDFRALPQNLGLPSAPARPIHYFEEPDRPQTALDRDLEGGMAISAGRLRRDSQFDMKMLCLSHNTLRGAAGGAVLLAELLCAQGYIS